MIVLRWAVGCDVAIESDPWVPLTATWEKEVGHQPCYLMISGASGGYVEVKVHPETGELVSLTVIDVPPQRRSPSYESHLQKISGVIPAFDLSAWSGIDPTVRVARESLELSHDSFSGGELLFFGDGVAEVEATCGPVAIGVDGQGVVKRFRFDGSPPWE